MKGLPAVLALCMALGAGQPPGSAPVPAETDTERAMFAVLRRDGVIAPFALLRGRTWSAPWPAGLPSRDLPLNLEAVPGFWWGGKPPMREWRAWLAEGRIETVTLQAPVSYVPHCSRIMGIRTDYRSSQPLPPVPIRPFPKDGIVISDSALRLETVEVVPNSGESWATLALSLLADFDRTEDLSAGTIATVSGWRHPVSRADRHRLGVRLESWYRVSLPDGATASYIEAVRSYEPGPEDEGCGLETFFSGWVFHRAGRPEPTTLLQAKVTYCDRVGATYMFPFGLVRARGRAYWLSQLSGWEDEWYVVTEVTDRRARNVVEYYAGGRECG